jgi:hypothetical protein
MPAVVVGLALLAATARSIIDDLTSAQHPATELVASGILDAVGIPSAEDTRSCA